MAPGQKHTPLSLRELRHSRPLTSRPSLQTPCGNPPTPVCTPQDLFHSALIYVGMLFLKRSLSHHQVATLLSWSKTRLPLQGSSSHDKNPFITAAGIPPVCSLCPGRPRTGPQRAGLVGPSWTRAVRVLRPGEGRWLGLPSL